MPPNIISMRFAAPIRMTKARKLLLGAILLLEAACAQQNVITSVNQLPFFAPSQLRYATRHGSLPLEIYGVLPSVVTPEYLAKTTHLPRGHAVTKLKLSPPGAAADVGRLVMVSHLHYQTHPEKLCEAAEGIATGNAQDARLTVGFCIGDRLAASGQVRVPAAKVNADSITRSVNVLLTVMLDRSDEGGGLFLLRR